MRRSRSFILGSVSALTLLAAATTSEALTPPAMNLGVLKSKEQWKVGTVRAAGQSYCAMVGKFDKQVVLAFARSPDGNGSLAMDFRENFFTPGRDYEVAVGAGEGRAHTLEGRASSARSIVVQVGQDETLYSELSDAATLEVGLPAISASFALRQFASAYNKLVDCAGEIADKTAAAAPPAVKVAEVESDPLDAAIENIEGKTAKAAAAKKDGFRDMEAVLDRDAAAEAKGSSARIAALEVKKAAIEEEIAGRKQQPAAAASDAPGRGLLDLIKGAVAKKPSAIEAEVEAKQKELAAIESEKARKAAAEVKAFSDENAGLKSEIAKAERQRDDLASKLAATDTDSKSLRARLVALQEEVASLKAQRASSTDELAGRLASVKSEYDARIASLTGERDALKSELAKAVASAEALRLAANDAGRAEKARADSAIERLAASETRAADVADRLAAAETAKKDAEQRIAAVERQNKILQAALGERIAAAEREDKGAKGQLAALQKSHDAQVGSLQKQLAEKTTQYDNLKAQYDALKTAQDAKLAENQGLIARLQQKLAEYQAASARKEGEKVAAAEKAGEIARLESQLRAVEAARGAEAEKALRAQADLTAARQQIAALTAAASVAPVRDITVSAAAPRETIVTPPKTSGLLPSERAELEEYRRGAPAVAIALPNPRPAGIIAKQPEVAIAPGAASPVARKKLGSVSDRGMAVLTDPPFMNDEIPPPVTSIEPAAGGSAVASVPVLATRAARAPVVKSVETTAPAAAPSPAKDEEIIWSPPRGYAIPKGYNVPEQKASADNFPMPAVPAEPVAAEPVNEEKENSAAVAAPVVAPALAAASAPNRAAAFLEQIMSYHRKGGAPAAPAPKAEEAPVVAAAAVRPEPVPTLAAAGQPPASRVRLAAITAPAEVEPAAGKAEAPIISPRVEAAPVSLARVLSAAKLEGVAYVPVESAPGEAVRQWTSGSLSGMIEQQPVSADFGAAIDAYLARYRDDCAGQLKAAQPKVSDVPAGRLAVTSISCALPGNSYTSSLVFLQDGARFSALLHTGTPDDSRAVHAVGDRIAAVLQTAGGIEVIEPATDAAAPLKFRSLDSGAERTTATYSVSAGEFETTVVQ